ncbi:hypothetical protein ACA910_017500 [Epithemia clementina (nom. ined.)]
MVPRRDNRRSHHASAKKLSEKLVFLLLLCLISQFVVRGQDVHSSKLVDDDGLLDDAPESTSRETPESIKVEDYLETLDNAALRSICEDRGFDIIPRKDGLPLERSDYLEAARRCLSLEDEMNAILAQNPDLAAELEAEIARMHQHKERLEGERDQLLAEKARLEQQLEQAGVDLLEAVTQQQQQRQEQTNQNTGSAPGAVTKKVPVEEMTFKDVMIESFSQLYDRVRLDVEFAWKFLGPVVRPLKGAVQLLWRYCRSHVKAFWEELLKRFKQIFGVAKQKIADWESAAGQGRNNDDHDNSNN